MTHPTQGLLDMYTALRALKKPFEDMRIIISTPDLSRARSGQSFALGAARMGAHIIYTGSSGLRTPQVLIDKLKSMGASFEEHFDLTHDENVELMARADLLYLPGSSLKKEDPNREDFMRKVANHYLYLNDLEYIKKKTGRVVGIMHIPCRATTSSSNRASIRANSNCISSRSGSASHCAWLCSRPFAA